MKKHITVLILIALISSSILGGSALALTNSEATPEIPVEASSESEAVVSDDDVIQIKSEKAATEEKEPVTLESLSPDARAKINDTFYEELKNADDDEIFEYMVVINNNTDEAENYRYPYDKSEYDWSIAFEPGYIGFEDFKPIGTDTFENGRYAWCYGDTEDIFIYYAEKLKTIKNNHDFMTNANLCVNHTNAWTESLRLTKSQILELLEDENVKSFAIAITMSF